MTDRHSGYVVALARDLREDDAEATIAAIQQIKGVLSVEPIISESSAAMIERARLRLSFIHLLHEAEDTVRSDAL